MFIIQGLLNNPSLVLCGIKNRLKTCERFALLGPRIPMRGARLTALLPFYRMRRLHYVLHIYALTQTYLGHYQTFMMECFVKIVNGF